MAGGMRTSPEAGWYPDPSGRAELRYWSGSAWTEWRSTDGHTVADTRRARRMDAGDIPHLAFIDEVFVPEGEALGVIDAEAADALSHLVARLTTEALQQPLTVEALTRAAPAPPSEVRDRPASAFPDEVDDAGVLDGVMPAAVRAQPRVREPGPLGQWWHRSRTSIGSDLAVHGLAYLGALLLFVGAFGLVAFAFGGVEPAWRPVAEVAIAAVPFLTAALLLRRGATVVGRSLEIVGGLLLPVMVMTAFLDDVPPDMDGVAMVVVMTLSLLAVAAGYAAWSRRYAGSALRYLASPLVWLAAGVATMGVGRALPAGAAVASLTAAQVSAMAVALAATLLVARRRPDHPLGRATLTAALPGAVVIFVMAVLTWLAEGWPMVPVLVTGLAGVAVLELLDSRLSPAVVAVLQPVWWAVTSLALLASIEPGPAGVVAAVGFVVLLERTASRRPDGLPLALSAGGAVVAFAVTFSQPWYGVALAAVVSVWAGWRRLRPFDLVGSDSLLDVTAVLVPLVGLAWVALATGTLAVPAAVGSGLVLLAAAVAAYGLLRRDDSDPFWTQAWAVAAVLVTVALAAAWDSSSAPQSLTWLLPLSAGLLVVAAAVGPMPALARPWAVLGFGTWAWAMLGSEVGLEVGVVAVVVAAAGLAVVVLAHTAQARLGAGAAGSLGLAGHALTLGALAAAASTTGAVAGPEAAALAAASAAATAGFVVTAAADARDRSAVGALLADAHPSIRYLAPALAAAGVPMTAALTMDAAGVAIWAEPWPEPILLGLIALGYSLLTRMSLPKHVGQTLAWAASAAAVLAAVTASDRPTALAGLAVLIGTAWLLSASVRPTPMVWMAWAAVTPLVGLVALSASSALAALPTVDAAATLLVGVGAVLTLGGLVIDTGGRSSAPQWRLSRSSLAPVVVTGVAQVLVALTLALLVVSSPAGGWLTLAVGAVSLAMAALRRAGALSGVAAVLAWAAAWMLAGQALLDLVWVPMLVGAALLVLADAARGWAREPWWARWDAPIFVAAHLVLATALVAALGVDERALVPAGVGGLALAVAWRLRANTEVAVTYAVAGGALVLAGAIDAGPAWTSLALLVIAGALVGLAERMPEMGGRLALQIGGAVAASLSWQQASIWWDLPVQRTADLTVAGAALLALVAAVALSVRPSLRSWALTWGGVATIVAVGTGLATMTSQTLSVSVPVVAGSGLLTLAWGVAAQTLGAMWLRGGAVAMLVATETQWLSMVEATAAAQVAVLTVTAALATLVSLAPAVLPGSAAWQRPALGLGAVTTLGAIVVAAGQLPEPTLLVPTFLVAAGVLAVAGVALSSVWLRVLAPMFACAAWVVFAAEALGDNPQWYTLPMGLALLVAVALLRQDARARGGDPTAPGIVTLELVGIAFVVGASIVQAVTDSLAYIALALLLGAAVGAWGLLTRVRRRVVAGGVVVIAAVVVLLAVPLVSLLPGWQGTALWMFLAGAGLVALLAATAIEKGRIVARKALARYEALGDEWE